jgi:hypothetical protein
MGAKVGCGPIGAPHHEHGAPPRQQEKRFLKLAEAGAPLVHLIIPTSFEIYAQSIEPIHKLYFESCPESDLNFLTLSRSSFSPFFIRMACGHCRRPLLGVVTVPSCQTSYAFRLSLLPLTCSSLAFSMPLPKRRMKIMPNSCPKM